jgi:hypothetical protein
MAGRPCPTCARLSPKDTLRLPASKMWLPLTRNPFTSLAGRFSSMSAITMHIGYPHKNLSLNAPPISPNPSIGGNILHPTGTDGTKQANRRESGCALSLRNRVSFGRVRGGFQELMAMREDRI